MEQIISNLRPFTFKVFLLSAFALLFLAPGCNSNGNNRDKQPLAQNATTVNIAPDSLKLTSNVKLDSLLRLAATAKQDTNLAKLYSDIGDVYSVNDLEKAKEYYIRLKNLSEKLNWNEGFYLYAAGFSIVLAEQGLTDSAIVISSQALDLAKKENNEKWINFTKIHMGEFYNIIRWNETALQYYMEVLPSYEKNDDKKKLGDLYYKIGSVYQLMNNMKKAIYYGEKAVTYTDNEPNSLLNLGQIYSCAQQYEKSKSIYKKVLDIFKQQNNVYGMGWVYWNWGADAMMTYDLYNAEIYLNKAVEISRKIDIPDLYLAALIPLGKLEEIKSNFAKSEEYISKALPLTIEQKNNDGEKVCYMILAELSAIKHKFRENLQYWEKIESVDMAKSNETSLRSAAEMEAKYETEKKELKISALEKEKQLVIWLSIAGGAVSLLALAAFILLWRWTVQKRRLAETRIKQFEQEKQLIATQAVLEGETRERARLARDLHDGLGSMLTGVKMNLLELKKGATLDFAEVERFDNAVGMLDESISEMRRVAHHLMPDSLSRFGLKPAVGDFCKNMPSVRFMYYGNESRLNPELEAMIYRSIYELVNNALKHGGATKILVQILQRPDSIAFTVQDDGCGFDPSAITEGMGLQNIRTRVAAFNGIMHIDSKAGEGTEINVELRIMETI